MRSGLFAKLAVTNIKKNRGTYIPYMITCMGCIAMLYIMLFIMANPDLGKMRGGGDISMIMVMGIVVVGIFSFVFLLYSNSFLMKRRQKEIGLYNILGMEKGHIAKMMFLETAVTTESPIDAIPMFLLAVLLVMAGTYLVFTAGSIAILKMLRWKKSFYYKMKNFTSVSGMIYRMKQNAVGLASICILSTGVLLMLSSTVCLNFGIEDIMQVRYPCDINIEMRSLSLDDARDGVDGILETLDKERIPCEKVRRQITLYVAYLEEENGIIFRSPENASEYVAGSLLVIPEDEYGLWTGQQIDLDDGEMIAYGQTSGETFRIMGTDFQVKEWLNKWPLDSAPMYYGEYRAVIVNDNDFARIYEMESKAYGEYASMPSAEIGIDVAGDAVAERACKETLDKCIQELKDSGIIPERAWVSNENRQDNYDIFYSMTGGLFFLGILLGGMFLMGTAMIIYYKQMSEGYEDKGRFEIMRKVGMSSREVRSSIHRQILMVFFLPLVMAILHITMAFPMVKKLLLLLGMMNTKLFMICTAGTILVFALVYGIIYAITARSYYRILEKAE